MIYDYELTTGTDSEIHEFCTLHYNTTFPQMKKADVNGANELLEKMFSAADPDWAKNRTADMSKVEECIKTLL